MIALYLNPFCIKQAKWKNTYSFIEEYFNKCGQSFDIDRYVESNVKYYKSYFPKYTSSDPYAEFTAAIQLIASDYLRDNNFPGLYYPTIIEYGVGKKTTQHLLTISLIVNHFHGEYVYLNNETSITEAKIIDVESDDDKVYIYTSEKDSPLGFFDNTSEEKVKEIIDLWIKDGYAKLDEYDNFRII